jgi:hypothetical protein
MSTKTPIAPPHTIRVSSDDDTIITGWRSFDFDFVQVRQQKRTLSNVSGEFECNQTL